MPKWIKRIQGALGMGLTWGAAWGVAGMVPRWIFGVNADAPFPLIFGVFGFIAGVTFSAIVAIVERRRRFDQISLPRFATWGAAGGVLLAAVFAKAVSFGWNDVLTVVPTFAVASSVCAVGSLALARRARRHEMLASGADTEVADHSLSAPPNDDAG